MRFKPKDSYAFMTLRGKFLHGKAFTFYGILGSIDND